MNPTSGEGLSKIGSLSRSSSIWRQTGDVFSRSSREEDDEEALRWAALEKLPTYNRVRRGILASASGKINEVDVENLGAHEKKALLERLVRVAEEDNERFLLKLKDRLDRVGIELPTIEVRYENLNIDAEAYMGNRGLPTVINSTMNMIESIANSLHILPSRKKKMSILHDVSGIIKPCRMTLLLGPPGAGKTTLLLALAGKLGSDLKVSGKVTYNGHEMSEFVPERTAAYISQHDLHMGELTVRETLAFSARCQGVGTRYDMLTELSRREKAANIKPDPDIDLLMKAVAMGGQEATVVTDYIMKILGLDICADIMVGNDMIRGISGGQRKRVTTGEMLVGPARALFMDEISTGLDSSTTFQIVNSIRQSIHILQGTAVISLLQPAPETYDLFDDIILISDGQVVYHGPRDNVLEFFESMGFKCPERKGVADFLQEVTSRKDQQQYWTRSDESYRYVPVKKFAEVFKSFHIGRAMADELAVPFDKSKSHPAALTTSKYGVSTKELLKAQIDREILLIKRNSFVYIYMFTQLIIIAFVTMTAFLRTRMHHDVSTDGNKFSGALFFGAVMIMFNGFSELAMTIMKLPVFFKQRDLLFFPAWTYTLPGWIVKIPIAFIEVFIWVFMTYYVIGFDPNVGRLFKQYILLLITNQMAGGLFRFMGGLARNMVVSNTFGSFAMLLMIVLGGFLLTRDSIKKWWVWAYWCSPLMYVQNAISVNEFMGHSWDKLFLLKRGGEEIYVGPLGHNSSELIEYFEAVPGVLKIKYGYNPATWMLEVTSRAQEEALGVDFTQLYKHSDLYKRNKALIRDLSVPPPESSDLYFLSQAHLIRTKFRPIHVSSLIEWFVMQIPGWWIWYYYICPVGWTLYGLVVSQYGDITDKMDDGTRQTVKDYVDSYYGFKHDFLPVVAVIVLAFAVLFAFLFGFSIKKFNFQNR
ncbi:pleiotropic drug resistance protein 3-like isoform X1 [Carex littledalei]|uniref:Pleiotropic drug resistance protein 3-like isoform X1 n=1 Tax=Carex littledalei TaxID=544730 RepID=A0A833R8I5_9POAL|nr:pleiotropic drug resistance protein 3-like isoform X1 [Carex littledalei]